MGGRFFFVCVCVFSLMVADDESLLVWFEKGFYFRRGTLLEILDLAMGQENP